MLLATRPVYSHPGADWAHVIEQETGAPVVLRSHGPTAADKTPSRPFGSDRIAA